MARQFTATIEKRGKWYVGCVESLPGVNTQGRTLREVSDNLKEAIALILKPEPEPSSTEPPTKMLERPCTVTRRRA